MYIYIFIAALRIITSSSSPSSAAPYSTIVSGEHFSGHNNLIRMQQWRQAWMALC